MRRRACIAMGGGLVVLALLGCHQGPVWSAPPSALQGVTVSLLQAEVSDDKLWLRLNIENLTGGDLVVDRNQIAIVGPVGSAFYAGPGHNTLEIAAGTARVIALELRSPYFNFREVNGVYVRFDGLYMGVDILELTAMALGQPSHHPGVRPPLALPPEVAARHEPRRGPKRRNLLAQVRRDISGAFERPIDPQRQEARRSSQRLEQYRGPRKRVQGVGLKLAAMPLQGDGVSHRVTFIMDDILLTELQTVGFATIGPEDINAMMGVELVKERAGCEDVACAAEIGNALNVAYFAAGSVTNLEGNTVLTLKLINVRNSSVVARASRIAAGGTAVLPRTIAEAVQELVERSAL